MAIVKIALATLFTLASSGALYQYVGMKLDEQKYPPIGAMVDIDGYKLHMLEQGKNYQGPTVIFDAGSGCCSIHWQLVAPEVAKFAHVVTYDRAGHGWSDPSPLVRTSENVVKELHTMLHNAQIPAPYILVGHSWGGLNVRLFASMYPDEIVGVVLVDSVHEEIYEKLPFSVSEYVNMFMMRWQTLFQSYLGISRLKSYFEDDDLHEKLKNSSTFVSYPSDFLESMCFALHLSTKYIQALSDERLHAEESAQQLKKIGGFLHDKPLTVITPALSWPTEGDDFNKTWQELQADLVTKSLRGKQIIAEKSDHMINLEQPEIIVQAIDDMIHELQEEGN
jgi:pimeloyl-ACP methyl ester carboxylesterase